jgi:7-keto-8-aminopelargonate synthetase-like enzyme
MNILNSGVGNYVISGGRKYSYFGGNNYLGLANHPEVKAAAIRAIEKYGVNFSASRRTTGTADLHLELEKKLAAFKGTEDAVIYASGFLGNGILLETMNLSFSAVFMDRLSHPSIQGSIPADIRDIQYYGHCDPGHLEELLVLHSGGKPLIITDGVFALTGEIAPLDEIYNIAQRYDALVIADDAHSTGILGKNGRGTPEYFHINGIENIYQTETMSKALGSYGGFIAGTIELTDSIRESSKTYQSSTALPPPVVAAGIASLEILGRNPDLRTRVLEKAIILREEIASMGFNSTHSETPIIPLIFDTAESAKDLSAYLEENGIIVPFMNYPVRQDKFLLRIAVTSEHTNDQSDKLLENLTKWKVKNGQNQDSKSIH